MVSAWSFLLTTTDGWTLDPKSWQGSISYLSTLLEKDDRSVRIAAGEALALIFEIGNLEKFSLGGSKGSIEEGNTARDVTHIQGLRAKILNQVRDLAAEAGGKGSAKKDLNNQRNTFRDILEFLEDGYSPETTVKICGDSLTTTTWRQLIQLNFLKHFLRGGFIKHMQENEFLHEVFDFTPKKKLVTGGDRVEKRMFKSPNSALNKARTRYLNKQRMLSQWPEWDPCRARVRINRDCGRGYPSVSYMRKRLKPRVRLASSGPRQCYLGLSSGLAIGLVRPGTCCNNTTQAPRPEMDLFAFIRHSDPTKVRVGDRNLAEREVKLLKMTEGCTVPLNPPVAAASGGSGDNVDKMFNEGYDANQEHLVERDDDVLEEVVALDALGVGAEKARKRQKKKATEDASGSDYPPKKLRDDYQPLPPPNGGKSLSALREMIPEGSAIPSDVMGPLSTASATPVSDVGPVDFVSGLNLRTHPPHERYVISPDSSHHSDSYSEDASLVRSVADVPVVTVAVTTTHDANVATGSKAKDVPKGFEHIGDSASVGGIEANAVSISKLKKPSISSDSFYASQSLDTETLHRVYVPRWKLRAMDYDHLYSEFNVGSTRQVCLGAEVRMRAEHTLEKKNELEDKCAEQANLLSERDAEITHLRSLLSLKEAEAAEAISLRGQLTVLEAADAAKGAELRDLKEKEFALEGEKNVLSERVEALESAAASKEVELTSLSSQVAKLTADMSSLQLSHDELNSKVVFLESERDCLATQVLDFYQQFLKSSLKIFAASNL
ncbi:(R)-mandelonitrile lyase-like protein [Tanacetum coccineum]